MAFFRRPKVAPDDLVELQEWVESRGAITGGVEAYVEPQTSFSPTTVVLVAGDGEFIRRGVPSPDAAGKFARSMGIPIYDTNRVGLPQRMRDYALRHQASKAAPTSAARAPVRTAREWDAITSLAGLAALPVPATDIDDDGLRALLRAARAKAHPDRNGGNRVEWDAVENAAHALGLR